MSGEYGALAGRIRLELDELAGVCARVRRIWESVSDSPDGFLVDAAALNLHSFYGGLERVFSSIAARLDRSVPTGDTWHVDLLRQMASEFPGVRPPVISKGLMEQLDRYRGFRHVVRNVYAYHLDPRQVAPLVEDLGDVEARLRSELGIFADHLMSIGEVEG